MLLVSHKIVFIKNEVTAMRNNAETCQGICGYSLVHNIFVYLLPSKRSVFVVHCSNAFYHGKEAFPKHGSLTKIVPLLVIFHLIYSLYVGI